MTNPSQHSIDAYLASLNANLAPITLAEREEIRSEISAHIRDSVESGTPLDTVLARLGPPQALAVEYNRGFLVTTASRSLSPITLLRAAFRLASRGLAGTLVFLFGLFGYTTGISLVLMGLLKPFMPNRVGMWATESTTKTTTSSDGLTTIGIIAHHGPHEILGWWAIPLGLIGGAIVLILTTLIIRGFLAASRSLQTRLKSPQYIATES